jgi:hypothetical protein
VATGIALTTNVEGTFSEAMNRATLDSSTFTLRKQYSSTTVSYDPNTSKATLDPGSDLAPNTSYRATVKGGSSGAKDAAGNALQQDYNWTFTTAPLPPPPPPTVTDYTPTQTTGVPRSIRPTATFSTNMDGTTITATSIKLQAYNGTTKKWTSVAHTVSHDVATRTVTVTPGSRLGASKKYRVTVTTGVKSNAGVALDQDASPPATSRRSGLSPPGAHRGQRVQSKSSKRAGASTTLRPSCSILPERRIKDPWDS